MSANYIIKRIFFMFYTIFIVTIIVFFITQVLPGDAAVTRLGENATKTALAALRARMGLEDPIWVQYGHWLFGVVTGDFGISFRTGQPVGPMIFKALSRSLLLGSLALFLALMIAVPLGIIAAIRRGGFVDLMVSAISYIGSSLPEFVTATILVFVFADTLQILPAAGYVPLLDDVSGSLSHLILPAFAASIFLTAHISRMVRSELIDVLNTDYIRAATLKGLSPSVVLFRHALRNALLPTITIVALDVRYLLGGLIVIEEIFAIPGIGRQLIVAINDRDIPAIQAGVLVVAVTFFIANFLADLAYSWLDPRIKYD